MKWVGIGVLYLLPFGYAVLMRMTEQPIEWAALAFMVAMAIGITLYATVFKKHVEDTQENRDLAVKILKKGIRGAIHSDK
jgi:hypothetical protein